MLRGKFNGAKHVTEAWDCAKCAVVGERRVRGEVASKGAVDCTGVRMPE